MCMDNSEKTKTREKTNLCWRPTRPTHIVLATSIWVGHFPLAIQPNTPQASFRLSSSMSGQILRKIRQSKIQPHRAELCKCRRGWNSLTEYGGKVGFYIWHENIPSLTLTCFKNVWMNIIIITRTKAHHNAYLWQVHSKNVFISLMSSFAHPHILMLNSSNFSSGNSRQMDKMPTSTSTRSHSFQHRSWDTCIVAVKSSRLSTYPKGNHGIWWRRKAWWVAYVL